MDKLSLPQHKHCLVCGKSIEMGKDFCSPECEKTVAARRKAQSRTTWIMMIVIGAVLVLFWIIMPALGALKPGG